MKKYMSVCALALVVGACSDSNPFVDNATTTTTPTTPTTPTTTPTTTTAVQGGMASFAYDPSGGGSLVVQGIAFDEDGSASTYRRRTGLDIMAPDGSIAYHAYTAQDKPLNEHTTAYAQTISDVTAVLAVTGGQFRYFDGGTNFIRTGTYDPVTVSESNNTGLVNYAGAYIGLSNVNGDNTDLLPVAAGTSNSIRPYQASQVNGNVFITVSFGDSTIKGTVYDRVLTRPVLDADGNQVVDATTGLDTFEVAVPDLILLPTTVSDEGTFTGSVEIPGPTSVGSYAGILGGTDSNGIAGGIYVDDHFDDASGGEEEYGIFVLGQCGTTASNDPALCAAGATQ